MIFEPLKLTPPIARRCFFVVITIPISLRTITIINLLNLTTIPVPIRNNHRQYRIPFRHRNPSGIQRPILRRQCSPLRPAIISLLLDRYIYRDPLLRRIRTALRVNLRLARTSGRTVCHTRSGAVCNTLFAGHRRPRGCYCVNADLVFSGSLFSVGSPLIFADCPH